MAVTTRCLVSAGGASTPCRRSRRCGPSPSISSLTCRQAYRVRSVLLHPDKNPHGAEAFKRLTEAYECLSSATCRREYNEALDDGEREILAWRAQRLSQTREVCMRALLQAYRLASLAARHFFLASHRVWEWAGEVTVELAPSQDPFPLGRSLLVAALLFKGRSLIVLYLLSYSVLRLNYHIVSQYGGRP